MNSLQFRRSRAQLAGSISAAALLLSAGPSRTLAGYTDPNQPAEKYTENGRRRIGPYRPATDGSAGIDGGLVSVTMIQRDPKTGAQVKRLIASGIILNNYYILTSAHGASFAVKNYPNVTTTIDWSTNCLITNPSAIEAAEITMYPGWTDYNKYSVPDIAVLKLKRPIAASDMESKPTFSTSKPISGSIITLAGYGVTGYSQATQFDDGQPRAGNGVAKTSSSELAGYSTDSYFSIVGNSALSQAAPAMVGANGDSGGLAIDRSSGAIVGMMVASTKTLPGSTIALDISAPLVRAFIEATARPVVPNNTIIAFDNDNVTLTWPSGYSGIVVQRSVDLKMWEDLPLPRMIDGTSEKMVIPKGSAPRALFRLQYRP